MLDRSIAELAASNVLLLGISYPCVESQMKKHGLDPGILTYKEPSVEQAVECVRRNVLTEMDARDLARCVAVEQATNTRVYTVSREIGAIYNDRHINCDFNTRNFCKKITDKFGKGIQFSQVILDYYWMPTGWLVTRWAKTLFQQTLPDLVRHQMFTFPSKRKKTRKHGTGPPYDIDHGVVFLPFCAHVCKELVGAIHILEQYYEISFLDKKDLHGHSLWKGTMEIDSEVMQHRLGKRLDQEEVYCKFRPKDIYESMEDPHVSKPAVMRILLAIKNYDDVRMIRLRPLRQHERASVFRERMWAPEVGGFMGLDFDLSARLLKEQKARKSNAQLVSIEEEKKEDDLALVEIKKKRAKSHKAKKGNQRKAALAPKETTRIDDDSPCRHGDEEGDGLNRFYPGPVQDLETYLETKRVVAQDLESLAAFRKKERLKSGKKRALSIAKTTGKGKIQLFGDESMKASTCNKKCGNGDVKTHGYLLFNPRAPMGGTNHGETEKEWELDWSIIPEAELESFLFVDKESDDDSSVVDDYVDPLLTDGVDLKAASNLYHGVLKGFSTANERVDGLERVTRVQVTGEYFQEETVCFTVDEKADSASKYKEFVVRGTDPSDSEDDSDSSDSDDDSEACGTVSELLSKCIERRRESILAAQDSEWISKTISDWPTKSLYIRGVEGADYQVKIDRMKNLRLILGWLLCGQENDDGGDCFRSIMHQLSVENPCLSDQPTTCLAIEIEDQLSKNIVAVAEQLWQNPEKQSSAVISPTKVVQMILNRLPYLSATEACQNLLSLQYGSGQSHIASVSIVSDRSVEVAHDDYDPLRATNDNLSHAFNLLELRLRVDNKVLIWDTERSLVPDILFITLQQLTTCFLADADRVRLGERALLGVPGLCCSHCSTSNRWNGKGRFFPDSRMPLSQQDTLWRSVVSHILSCEWCPTMIKSQLNSLVDERVNSEGKIVMREDLENADRFLSTVQRRVNEVATFSCIDTIAAQSTVSSPCQGIAIKVVCQDSRMKRTNGSQSESSSVSAADTISNQLAARNNWATERKSLASNHSKLTVGEESKSVVSLPWRENVLQAIADKDSGETVLASSLEAPPENDAAERMNSKLPNTTFRRMDSLSRLFMASSMLMNSGVKADKDTGASLSKNPDQNLSPAGTMSVLEVVTKSSLENEMAMLNPAQESGGNKKRPRSIVASKEETKENDQGLPGEKRVKSDSPSETTSKVGKKQAWRDEDSSPTSMHAGRSRLNMFGHSRPTDPLQGSSSTLGGTTNSNEDVEITPAGSPRRKCPTKLRDPTALPQLALDSASPLSTKQEGPRTLSSKRGLRMAVTGRQPAPNRAARTMNLQQPIDSLGWIAPTFAGGPLYRRNPDVFGLSRQDPGDDALKNFLIVSKLNRETYTNWILTCGERDHAALLHRICLWCGSGGKVFESPGEKKLLDTICSELLPLRHNPQDSLDFVREIQKTVLAQTSQANTVTMTSTQKCFTTASPYRLYGRRAVSPPEPFPPSSACHLEAFHPSPTLPLDDEAVETTGGAAIAIRNIDLA